MATRKVQTKTENKPARKGGLDVGGAMKRKMGPLPMWAWVGLGVGGLLIISNMKGGKSTPTDTTPTADTGETPTVVVVPGASTGSSATATATANSPAAPKPKPAPKPSGGKGRKYTTITVSRWNPHHPVWSSTLSGIAQHYHVAGGYKELARLNHIKNPNVIRPGQKIKVPVSRKTKK